MLKEILDELSLIFMLTSSLQSRTLHHKCKCIIRLQSSDFIVHKESSSTKKQVVLQHIFVTATEISPSTF